MEFKVFLGPKRVKQIEAALSDFAVEFLQDFILEQAEELIDMKPMTKLVQAKIKEVISDEERLNKMVADVLRDKFRDYF